MINAIEAKLSDLEKEYPIYPKIEVVFSEWPIDLITYIRTNNGYLAPLRLRYFDGQKGLNINDLGLFILDFKESVDTIIEKFNGWEHFENKANYIYKDGIVLTIYKLKEDDGDSTNKST